MKITKNKKLQFAFILAGALAGFLYWRFIGCTSGSCPIQSHWAGSTLLGALLGSFAADLFQSRRKNTPDNQKLVQNAEGNE